MSWNINHTIFNNFDVQNNNLVIYGDKNQRITLWVEEEIKKAKWNGNSIMVYLKRGEIRKYLNDMHYVTLRPTALQKALQFISVHFKKITNRVLPFISSHKKYNLTSSANV